MAGLFKNVPGPDELDDSDEEMDEMEDEEDGDEEGDDEAAAVGLMEELGDALGVKLSNPKAACDALDAYLDARGYRKG